MGSSSESEGEIIESGSEKATKSLPSVNGISVDRQSRTRAPASTSPDHRQSPRRRGSRSPVRRRTPDRYRDRSPYSSRGEKRRHHDYDHSERSRPDGRRFKVHYEDRPRTDDRRHPISYADLDDNSTGNVNLRYDDREGRDGHRDKRARTRSRSPYRNASSNHQRKGDRYGQGRDSHYGNGHSAGDPKNTSSVVDALKTLNGASISSEGGEGQSRRPAANTISQIESDESTQTAPKDEATLIEERRKRREAIKAKYRNQATPMLVQALHSTNDAGSSTSTSATPRPSVSPKASPPGTPKDAPRSPTSFAISKDEDLANERKTTDPDMGLPDEPSAADYDPTIDMREDRHRDDQRHQAEEMSSEQYDETKQVAQDILLPASKASGKGRSNDEFDMFAEDDDMFAEHPMMSKTTQSSEEGNKAVPVPQANELDMGMLDDWDDPEGYYKVILGELLEGRYHVQANLGKGMFSGVVRAMDNKTKKLVAIKIIRNNDTMKKAGLKEIEILQTLMQADPEDKKHLIRLERYFQHKGHLCMVFENLSINLREVLKKFGRDVGINLKAVRAYAQQMFLGLSLLRKCNIVHADLKPDNVLVNENRNLLKICDLGSASDASENEITPYLVSRFYRAPEIILGIHYDFAIDMWSIGCTLYELYTGKILFTGRTNNQMLRAIMECRGKFSHKLLKKAEFAGLHFDEMLNFRSVEKDKLTGKDTIKMMNFTKPTRDLKTRLSSAAKGLADADLKELNLFIDLIDRCLNLNPEKRCTPAEALKHPFISRSKA